MDSKWREKKRKMEEEALRAEEEAAARKADRKQISAALKTRLEAAEAARKKRMEAAAAARLEVAKNAKMSYAHVPVGLLGPIAGYEMYRVSLKQGDTTLASAVLQVTDRSYDPSRMVLLSMEKIPKE